MRGREGVLGPKPPNCCALSLRRRDAHGTWRPVALAGPPKLSQCVTSVISLHPDLVPSPLRQPRSKNRLLLESLDICRSPWEVGAAASSHPALQILAAARCPIL